MTNKIVFSACLAAMCIVPLGARAQGALTIPPPRGMLSDFAGVVTAERAQQIEALAQFVRAKGGGEIAVVTLPDLAGRDVAEVALQIGREWKVGANAGVGDARRNAGVVVLVVPKESSADGRGYINIQTGQGVEGFIPDTVAGDISREAVPYLQQADYASALLLITLRISERYAAEFGFSLDSAGEQAPVPTSDSAGVQAPVPTSPTRGEPSDGGGVSLVSEERTKASAATVRSIVTIFSALIVLCALIGGGWLLIRRAKARKSQSKPVRSVAWSETEDIHEPVEVYRQHLKDRHAINTKRYFEELVERSGINEEKNRKTVEALRRLELTFASVVKTRFWWKASRLASVGAAVIFGFLGLNNPWFFAGTAIIALIVLSQLNPKIREISAQADDFEKRIKTTTEEAWSQMAPLNRLYGWPILSDLFQQTVPRIVLDTYLTQARINELQSEFKWNASLGDDTSIVFAHSGALNGNPFILARTLDHWMGTKTYHGSLQIQWTERVKSSNGRYQTVQRSETLHASVTKPFPEYTSRTHIFYGNEAAPDLTFSRKPTLTSKSKTGVVGGFLRWFKLKRLESKSRKATSTKSFTLMSNNEFEVLFDASNRNHEVQFRLLFTALAQQEMIALIRDRDVGYGDTFIFHKDKMMNVISASHMDEHDISGDPRLFHNYDIDEARSFFNDYHNTFFRSFFFALSPLLSIPLYQQHRSHLDIYRDSVGRRAAEWEHESIANYLGEEAFMHPACITRNILKTKEERSDDGMSLVEVTAAGFRGVERRDFVEKRGGDGRSHMVPVDWIEYFEVSNSTEVWVHDASTTRQSSEDLESIWTQAYAQRGIDSAKINVRRGIAMSLG